MERPNQRIKRLTEGKPDESILTLLNSQGTYFVDAELKPALKRGLWNLLILGIHAVAETWAELIYPKVNALTRFKLYLENFVDGDEENVKFSLIAKEINDWRNVIAHQWLGSIGHKIGFDTNIPEGWIKKGDILTINPKIYYECFESKFDLIWAKIKQITTPSERETMKQIIINKYCKY